MATVLPHITETWSTYFNTRYAYVSLAGAVGAVMYNLTTRLIAAGYTCKGSCSSGTGLMDTTNRWTSAAAVTPRATTTGASQAWMVLTDGNGIDILFTYQGATDDAFKISFSASGVFVAAGTPNQQPTATDEAITMNNAQSLVGTSTTADRVWHIWISSDHKSFRCVVGRSGTYASIFGQEKATSSVLSPCTFSPASYGYFYAASSFQQSNVLNSGQAVQTSAMVVARVNYGGNINALIGGGTDCNADGCTYVGTAVRELQGGQYPYQSVTLISNHTSARGKLGHRIDWWIGRTGTGGSVFDGDQPGGAQFVQVGDIIFTGDGSTTLAFA